MKEALETGLIGGPEKREIVIVAYDELWPIEFEKHKFKIQESLGSTAIQIEHIGSTSVPGLAAKPIIDILVVVEDSADESAYHSQLVAAGYQLRVREPDWQEHRMFRTPNRSAHIHIYSQGCPEIERYLVFRNRLRSNPDDKARYEQVKRELAKQSWSDINEYAEAKSKVVEEIIAAGKKQHEFGPI